MDDLQKLRKICLIRIAKLQVLKREIKKAYPDAGKSPLFGTGSKKSWLAQARELKAQGRLN